MSLKDKLLERGMKALSDPRVAKLATDPRVMKAVMQAMAMPGKVQQLASDQIEALAKRLHLATEDEVAQLRRTVRRLEEELDRERGGRD